MQSFYHIWRKKAAAHGFTLASKGFTLQHYPRLCTFYQNSRVIIARNVHMHICLALAKWATDYWVGDTGSTLRSLYCFLVQYIAFPFSPSKENPCFTYTGSVVIMSIQTAYAHAITLIVLVPLSVTLLYIEKSHLMLHPHILLMPNARM